MSDFEHTHRADFWNAIYDGGNAPWDLEGSHDTLKMLLELRLFGEKARVFVPGAGRGHDALLLAQYGHDVVAADFAEAAVAHLQSQADLRSLSVDARQCDIFDLDGEPEASFDGVFEYTCFCAIDPGFRERYRDLMTHLVRPGGLLVMFAFPIRERTGDGPPHGVSLDELRELFEPGWTWLFDSEPRTVPEARRSKERLVVWRRR